MIAISTQTFDLDGHVVLAPLPGTEIHSIRRRVQVAVTLDADVASEDQGYVVGDRRLNIVVRNTPETWDALRYLVANYQRLSCSTYEAIFDCRPMNLDRDDEEIRFTLLPLRTLS